MARVPVRLTPRGGADRIDGWEADAAGREHLKARVRAAPTEGEANAALIVLLAKALKIPKSDVSIARGASARLKIVEVDGLSDEDARRGLEPETG